VKRKKKQNKNINFLFNNSEKEEEEVPKIKMLRPARESDTNKRILGQA